MTRLLVLACLPALVAVAVLLGRLADTVAALGCAR